MPSPSHGSSSRTASPVMLPIHEVERRYQELAVELRETQIPSMLAAIYNAGGSIPYDDFIEHPLVPVIGFGGPLKRAVEHGFIEASTDDGVTQFDLTTHGRNLAVILGEMEVREMSQSPMGSDVAGVMNHLLLDGRCHPDELARVTGLDTDSIDSACNQLANAGLIQNIPESDDCEVTLLGRRVFTNS